MGLDLSLTGTGVAILRLVSGVWERPELHTVRPIPAPKGPITRQYEGTRLMDVVAKILKLGVVEETQAVGIEDYAYGISAGKTNCVFQLGELGGAVRYQLMSHGVPFVEIPISVGKKFATGSGSAKKDQVADCMSKLWDLPKFEANQFDASDALSLASVAATQLLGSLPGKKMYRFQTALVGQLEVVKYA